MLRYNAGKPQLSLVPTQFLLAISGTPFEGTMKLIEDVAHVLTFGAVKYTANTWRQGGSWLKNLDSGFRHIAAYLDGQIVDAESGLHHLAHLGCNIAFLLTFQDENLGTDDRYRTSKMLDWDAASGSIEEVIEQLILWRDGGNAHYLRRAAHFLALYYEEIGPEELAAYADAKASEPDSGAPAAPGTAEQELRDSLSQPAPAIDPGKIPIAGTTSLRDWLAQPDTIHLEGGKIDGDRITILFFDPDLFPHLMPNTAGTAH